MRKRGITLPVLIGLPGPVERAKLLSMATKIGVGQSVRFLKSHATAFARIAAPGGYNPEKFLRQSAELPRRDPELNVAGLHLFTFNQVAETEAWRQCADQSELRPSSSVGERALEEAALGVVG